METKTTIQGLTKNVGNSSASEITEVVKRKPIKGEYLNLKGQVFPKSIQNEILEEIKRQGADNEDFMDLQSDFIWENSAKGYKYWDNLYENTDYNPAKLKNVTQQKRVELIETQKWELIAATATIDNQLKEIQHLKTAVSALENSLEIKNRTIKKQSDELEKLGETCGNLVRTKLRNESTIKDLTKRNGNLKTITNDQTERIEILEHENKNYESAIEVLEVKETRINELYLAYEKRNQELEGLMSKATESRERLASKFTNWFIFLVFTNVVSIAWGVYQLLTK